MNLQIARNSIPLKWRDNLYQIEDCGIKDSIPYAQVAPEDQELVAELKAHILQNQGLEVYVHDGYKTLIESSAGV